MHFVFLFLQKYVFVAIKSRQQKALTIKKLQNCKCDKSCHFAGRLPVQILHVLLPTIFENSDGRLKRKAAKKKGLGAISAQKMAQWVIIWSLQCSKKWDFEGRMLRVGFQKCASRSSGEHNFVKIQKNAKRDSIFANKCVYSHQKQAAKGTRHQKVTKLQVW